MPRRDVAANQRQTGSTPFYEIRIMRRRGAVRGLAAVGAAAGLLLSARTVGPNCERPSAQVPAQYKDAGWKIGEPLDAIGRDA
jgi:hypothetical protein